MWKKNLKLRGVCFAIIILSICAFVGMGVQNSMAENEAISVSLGTGGLSGVYYPVGGAIARLVNKNTKETNIRVKVESTEASVYNVQAIRLGKMDVGIVQTDVQHHAYTGTGPEAFVKAGPDKKLRALCSLYGEVFTLVAREDAHINTFDDLAGKRVNIGDIGSGNYGTMEELMKEYGWTDKTFKLATNLQPKDMVNALCDNKIDAYVYILGHPNSFLKEALAKCASHIVPLEGPVVDRFVEKDPFYPKVIIPLGLYKNMPKDVPSFGPRASLLANSDLPDDVAYAIVKAIFSNLDEFKKMHPALAHVTAEEMLKGNSAPFHPGAVRYFKEAGIMK